MIKVYYENEDINHDVFEFLRLKFPSYDKSKKMEAFLDKEDNFKIEIICDEFKKTIITPISDDNREQKHIIKQEIYKNLYTKFENKDPWGILTGVRPVKLALNALEKNNSMEETRQILKNHFLLEDDSVNLCLDIAKKESEYIYPINKNRYSLYIHIPFCPTKCSYCSFLTMHNDLENTKKYTTSLIKELIEMSKYIENSPRTVYIGGGTPTAIETQDLEKIIKTVNKYYGKTEEFTVECGRPDTINMEKLLMLKNNGVNRISINPQTMRDSTLERIGRSHSVLDIIEVYNIAREIGFKSINMDLILGLPGEYIQDVKYSLEEIFKLSPENITIHTLAIKNGSKLYDKSYNNNKKSEEILKLTKKMTKENGYKPYYMYRQKRMMGNGENIGYSKEGNESIYNIVMMEEKESVLGFGMCSTSKFFYPEINRVEKVMQFRNLEDYINKNHETLIKKKKYLKDFKF